MPHTLFYRLSSDGVTRTTAMDVDLLMNWGSTADSQITRFPIEDGSQVSDHQVENPDNHQVEAVVTDRPIGAEYQPGRARAAWQTLKEVKKAKERLVLALPGIGDQPSVKLARMSVRFDSTTGTEVLRFTATFEEVQVAVSARVPAQKRRETKAKPNLELGQQTTSPTDTATEEKSRTLLKQIKDSRAARNFVKSIFGGG